MALDDVSELIDAGKEKGPLTRVEGDPIPHDARFPKDLEDLFTALGMRDIDVLEAEVRSSALEEKFEEEVEADVPHLPSGTLAETYDPVRASTCARWAWCPCSTATRKWTLPSASSADNSVR